MRMRARVHRFISIIAVYFITLHMLYVRAVCVRGCVQYICFWYSSSSDRSLESYSRFLFYLLITRSIAPRSIRKLWWMHAICIRTDPCLHPVLVVEAAHHELGITRPSLAAQHLYVRAYCSLSIGEMARDAKSVLSPSIIISCSAASS